MAVIADPILTARLQALEDQLKKVEPPNPPSRWITDLDLDAADFPTDDEEVWRDVADGIRLNVMDLRADMGALRTRLAEAETEDALAAAWSDYRRIYENSQDVFRESLEFLGGLVFRQKTLRAVYGLADSLVRELAKKTGKRQSFTVPSSNEAVKRTFGRIIRLRYPEWSIWTLPLTAHVYGYVMVEEPPPAGAPPVALLADGQPQVVAVEAGPGADRITRFLNEYYAETFATFTMGPAYACAALLLRFNPACDTPDAPSQLVRAEVILQTLKKMSDDDDPMNAYPAIIERLEQRWSLILQRTRPASILTDAERQQIATHVDDFYRLIDRLFVYSFYSQEHLQRALQWASAWNRQLKESHLELKLPDIPIESSLRDVLNAAWLSRLAFPNEDVRIASIAHELCGSVLKRNNVRKRQPARQSARSAGASKPRVDGGR